MDLLISDGDAASIARRIGKRIIQGVSSILKIHISIGIGTLKRDWKELSDSTEEAFYALLSKSVAPFSDYHLFEYKKVQGFHGSSGQPIRPIQFYHQLAYSIRHSQKQRAVELIQEYMAQLRGSADITPSYLHFLANELWAIFAYSLYDVGIILDDILPDYNFQAEIEQITHPHQLEELLIGKVKTICGNRQWKENIKHKKVVEFMIQYIHEHYAKNISLIDLANQVCISRNYLSQIFRKATGESFNQYVTRVRMEKAKTLILEGKYMIYEIAEMVGFKNTPYFSTLFKKYTGLNPSDLMGK
jgi:two-component system response regulator YesN